MTTNLFATLGVGPALGAASRTRTRGPGAPRVVVLSDGLWRDRFAGDPDVLGRPLVAGRRAGHGRRRHAVAPGAAPDTELWQPLTIGEGGLQRNARGRFLMTVARLRESVTVGQAQSALDVLARQLAAERPEFNTGWDVFVAPLHADMVRDARPAVLVLFGAVALVLADRLRQPGDTAAGARPWRASARSRSGARWVLAPAACSPSWSPRACVLALARRRARPAARLVADARADGAGALRRRRRCSIRP